MFESSPVATSLDFPPSQKQRPTYPVGFFPSPPSLGRLYRREPACAALQRPHPPSRSLPACPVKAALLWGMKEREAGVGDGRATHTRCCGGDSGEGRLTAGLFQSENTLHTPTRAGDQTKCRPSWRWRQFVSLFTCLCLKPTSYSVPGLQLTSLFIMD